MMREIRSAGPFAKMAAAELAYMRGWKCVGIFSDGYRSQVMLDD